MNSFLILTFTGILSMVVVIAVPVTSRLNSEIPTEEEAIQAVDSVNHHLVKRQMPDMDMLKDMAPALMDTMMKEASSAMEEKMAEGGTEEEVMKEGAKKMLEMGTSAMQMFQSMQG